jgi:hypothetical protein
MSDLTNLFDALKAVATKDYRTAILPEIAAAAAAIMAEPAAAPVQAAGLLAKLSAELPVVAADEIGALSEWIAIEAAKVAAPAPVPNVGGTTSTPPAPAPAPVVAP